MTVPPIDDARLAEVRARFDAISSAEADSHTGHVKGLLARLDASRELTINECLAVIDGLKDFVPVQGDRVRFSIYDLTRAFRAGIAMAREDIAALSANPALENCKASLADANSKESLSQDQEIAGLREEVRRKDERIGELVRVVRLYCGHDKLTDGLKIGALANHPYFAPLDGEA